ncbi:MAG: hypothetical protein AABY02_02320, partial [Nanoarchaeota archaeon]
LDIDSPYLDYSKIAAALLIECLERYGIKNYGIKYSGSKGFHIIVPWTAFPDFFENTQTKNMFPEWPRAITEFLLHEIKPELGRRIDQMGINFAALERRTGITKEEFLKNVCANCNIPLETHMMIRFECDKCQQGYERPDMKITARKLRCLNETCGGYFSVVDKSEFFKCPKCNMSSLNKQDNFDTKLSGAKVVHADRAVTVSSERRVQGQKASSPDLVLVSPRHLFRMPYSLHEKTSLASVVITKQDITNFSPKKADPLTASILPYYPTATRGEAALLLQAALAWKVKQDAQKPIRESVARPVTSKEDLERLKGVTEKHFPPAINKLMKGLAEGRKRGLFILITFLRALNFPDSAIEKRVYEWNEKNTTPIKEGYVKRQ